MSILKYTTKYVILGVLGFVLIIGIVALVSNQLDKSKSDSVVEGENPTVRDGTVSQTPLPVNISTKKPPPPGETEGTGHWHGNVWHRTVPTPVKNSAANNTTSQIHFDYDKESLARARRIIRDRPYSEDALDARLFLAEWDESGHSDSKRYLERLYDALPYHPDHSYLLALLGVGTCRPSPYEAIGYAEKAIKNLYEGEDGAAIYGNVLAVAYQRLGDSKTAMMYLKKAQKLVRARPPRTGHIDIKTDDFSYEIEALASGTWDVQPMEGLVPDDSSEVMPPLEQPFPLEDDRSDNMPKDLVDIPPESESSETVPPIDFQSELFESERERANVETVKQLQKGIDVLEYQSRLRQQQAFIEWTQSLLKASENDPQSLMDALEKQLLPSLRRDGEISQEQISSLRMKRAASLLRLWGPEKGLEHLRKVDPQLSEQLHRSVTSKNIPTQRPSTTEKKENSK